MSAIPVSTSDAQLKRLYEVAQEYRAKNYRVIVGPSQRELPEFLRGFEPDLLVTSDDDRAVIEVKQRRALIGTEDFTRLAEIVEQQPGWRFELVLVPDDDQTQEPLPGFGDIVRITALLEEARKLHTSGMALIPAVAAVEHAMVIAAALAGLELPSRSAAAVLKTLCAYGRISTQAYNDLDDAFRVRNEVVHGAHTDVDAGPWIEKIEAIVEELIATNA